jgi:hypothetical protein
MCVNFDTNAVAQCREDDAEEVFNKERANFCDWYEPSSSAFNSSAKNADETARSAADALFSDDSTESMDADNPDSAAEDLFR